MKIYQLLSGSAFKAAGEPLKRIKKYKVWQDGNHPVELDTNKMLDQRLSYLHNNPVEHGIVLRAEDYVYSGCQKTPISSLSLSSNQSFTKVNS